MGMKKREKREIKRGREKGGLSLRAKKEGKRRSKRRVRTKRKVNGREKKGG